jgi:hypothetical protein
MSKRIIDRASSNNEQGVVSPTPAYSVLSEENRVFVEY